MSTEPIRNLSSLNLEIRRLEEMAKQKGGQLESNMSYLQDHYGRMTMNSVFTRQESGRDSIRDKVFSAVWENDVVQKGINTVVSHMAEGASSLIDQLLSRIRNKKEDKA